MQNEKKSFSQVFADRLRLLREAQGWSQQNMADALNVCRSTYTRYENASSSPSLELTQRIARLLNADIRFLFQLPTDETPLVASGDGGTEFAAEMSGEERQMLLYYRSLDKNEKKRLFEELLAHTLEKLPSEEDF